METKSFALTPVLDERTGKYVVDKFGDAKKLVADFIEREVNSVTVVDSEPIYKVAKETRTDIRKKKDAITQARININALLLGDFNAQLKEIEAMLDEADKSLKAKIDDYNVNVKGKVDNRPRVITLVVKGYDEKLINKVKDYAVKYGLSAEVK